MRLAAFWPALALVLAAASGTAAGGATAAAGTASAVPAVPAASAGAAEACDRANFVVAIDPGHTRESPGAISARGVPEWRFNDRLAARVLDELRREGFVQSFATVRGGAEITLAERAQRANERDARLFVSIHHDSAQPQRLVPWTYRGTQRLVTDEIRGHSLFVSRKNTDFDSSLNFARLLGTRLRNDCLAPTLHHAEDIPGERRELIDPLLGIYRFDDLVVLKSARMPALLFEAGVIVNRDEELELRKAAHAARLAQALVRSVIDFCAGVPPAPATAAACR